MIVYIKDPDIHVRVQWIMETWKDPACTKNWQNNQPIDFGHDMEPLEEEEDSIDFEKMAKGQTVLRSLGLEERRNKC